MKRPRSRTERFIDIAARLNVTFHASALTFVTFAALAVPRIADAQTVAASVSARIERVLRATPLIDGHNDLAWELREKYASAVASVDLSANSDRLPHPLMTDIARLRQGRVGGQFWSVYIPSEMTGDAAIRETIEQIDIVRRLVDRYPRDLALATTASDVERIHRSGRIASLMGMEGGHQIGNSLAALRQFHALGVRYMTLTHFKNNDWADSATDDPVHNGLTPFGRAVVGEMNRIGMIVDLAHVSPATMKAALAATRAPVIFSHSDARALNDHPRNVPDDVLTQVKTNGGVVMVNFYPTHLSAQVLSWSAARDAEEARGKAMFSGQPDRRKAALDAWDRSNPRPRTTPADVADHIEHITRLCGHGCVGIGGDLDGVPYAAEGLDSVAGYPLVFAELIRRGWSDTDLAALAGGNVLRVMRGVEATSAAMHDIAPSSERLLRN